MIKNFIKNVSYLEFTGRLFIILLFVQMGGIMGCSVPEKATGILEDQRPVASFRSPGGIPNSVRRVALLPVTVVSGKNLKVLEEAGEVVEKALPTEIQKSGLFQPVPIPRDVLEMWTGRLMWRLDEPLPSELIETVATQSGSDAVLFTSVTEFVPYNQPGLGLRMYLVGKENDQALWQMDHYYTINSESRQFEKPSIYQKGKVRYISLDDILGLPYGDPLVENRTYFPIKPFIKAAVSRSLQSLPERETIEVK